LSLLTDFVDNFDVLDMMSHTHTHLLNFVFLSQGFSSLDLVDNF